MKASEAKKLTKAVIKRRTQTENDRRWDDVAQRIKNCCDGGLFDLEIPLKEMTDEMRKRLKDNGYKINKLNPPEDPEDMHYIQISWE